MKIVSFDVGKSTGWAYLDITGEETGVFQFTSLAAYEKCVKDIIQLYKPDVVVTAYPTRFYRVIVYQSKLAAIVELCCEKKNIQFAEVNDSTCKKDILGNGKASKEEIMQYFNKDTEHEADALMFATHIYNANMPCLE